MGLYGTFSGVNMKLFVTAKANARQESVEQIDETHFKISVTEPPIEGKANLAIARVIAKHLSVPSWTVEFISGHKSKQKVFEVKKYS